MMGITLPLEPSKQIDQLSQIVEESINNAKEIYVKSIFAKELGQETPELNGLSEEFRKLLFGLETIGYDFVRRSSISVVKNGESEAWEKLIWPAYRLRRTLEICEDEKNYIKKLNMLFSEALDGITSHRQPELRLKLSQLEVIDLQKAIPLEERWDQHLELEIKRAFLLLTRKRDGYVDLDLSAEIIKRLREKQNEGEKTIEEIENPLEKQLTVFRTLALYNCAKALELTIEFSMGKFRSESGKIITTTGLKDEVDRYIFNAREVLSSIDPLLKQEIGKLGQACHSLINSSVFSFIKTQGIKKLLSDLSSREKDKPILELWYAQKQALNDLLNPTKTAIVLSLPTSSGKTLLAEMAINQAYENDPDKLIVYLAPTRALVTQVSLTLKKDLDSMIVFVATPAFELNDVESKLLRGQFNILVTTPEKFDLLLRRNHESVQNLSLVVVDEAHNLAEEERGAKLEMLLATLRRERECKFLLMTPFARNADDLAFWLGQDKGASIVLDWKPNDRVVGILKKGDKIRKSPLRKLTFQTMSSIHSDCPSNVEFDIATVPDKLESKKSIAIEGTKTLARIKQGGVLLLAKTRKDAVARATELANGIDDFKIPNTIDLICRFLDTEANGNHPLSTLLRKGIGFHHAGLSPEARYFVERLVEDGEIKIVCATTSLAQGMNFPLSAAVIESYYRPKRQKGQWSSEALEPWEFWNIAGRVGRTLQDNLGTVVFASKGNEKEPKNKNREDQIRKRDIDKIQDYLDKDAEIVVSSLIRTLEALQGKRVIFNINTIEKQKSLSAFLQYLLHAIASTDIKNIDHPSTLVKLLQSSLVFYETQKKGQQFADELVRLANEYVDHLKRKSGLKGYVKIADGTGFSSPSVDYIWHEWRGRTQLSDWHSERIFPDSICNDSTLSKVMSNLGEIPEIRLGSDDEGTFSPVRVARITSMWVNGTSLSEIAQNEYKGDILECTKHIYSAITNLVPWGMQAIQRVAFAGEKIDWSELSLIPAMALHGVKTKEAIALRMLNIPRFIAENLAKHARESNISPEGMSKWIEDIDYRVWDESLPSDAKITGKECKLLWQIIEGKKTWKDLHDTPL